MLAAQHYSLRHWRSPERNVRRFFDIDDLVGVRVEDPDVFARTHALVIELVADGSFDALRVDHVDGLRDPAGYLDRLAGATGVPVLVEKILGPDETLPAAWPVAGTSGYEHLADLDALFVESAGLWAMDDDYLAAGGLPFAEVEAAARRQVLHDLFPTEWHARGAAAAAATGLPEDAARDAVAGLTVGLDVYRTYLVTGQPPEPTDRQRLTGAADRAGAAGDEAVRTVHDALADPDRAPDLTARWQQLSGAVMAKGHEDTAYYRHTRLLALNEVGGDPDGPLHADPLRRFHARQAARAADGRAGMTTTTTHDTKRSEDTRSRLLALTEIAPTWIAGLESLRAALPPTIDRDEMRTIAQTLVGAWPLDDAAWPDFEPRVLAYLRKALRERKETTSWVDPDETHEEEVLAATSALLADRGATFDRHLGAVRERVAVAAATTSLTRVVLKHAAPGVPDLYRGAERWALDLADPDNRRPVDHDRDIRQLQEWVGRPPALAELRRSWRDGRIKLWCTWRTLTARRSQAPSFVAGRYVPVAVTGAEAHRLVAFARVDPDRVALAVGARRGIGLDGADGFPVGAVWGDTRLDLSTVDLTAFDRPVLDVLDPDARPAPASPWVRDLLPALPAALLVSA